MSTMYDFLGFAEKIDNNLNISKEELHEPKINLDIDTKSVSKADDALKNAQKRQKELVKRHEKDNKKYKALKKYGEVLQLVEKLLGLIPGDLANLSTEELERKLEELLKTRKKNEQQIIFTFYQNMLTDLLTNLVTIEKNHKQGLISPSEALVSIKIMKTDFKNAQSEMPANLQRVLGNTMENASHLLDVYENSFCAEQKLELARGSSPLKDTDLNDRHDILFTKLNNDTNELLNNVNGLSLDLSNFEPHVDLSKLTSSLKSTDELLQNENWNAEQLDSAVSDLQTTTISLTDKQIEINNTKDKLEEEIKSCSDNATELAQISMQEISRETFKDMEARAEESSEIAEETINIIENDQNLSTTVGVQIAETLTGQLEADEQIGDKLVVDPNAASLNRNNEATNQALDNVEGLSNQVLTIAQQRELLLHLEMQNPEDDESNNKK